MKRTKRATTGGRRITWRRRATIVALGLAGLLSAASISAQTKGSGATPEKGAAPASKAAPKSSASPTKAPAKKIDLALVSAQLSAPATLALGLADAESAGSKAKTLAPRIEELLAKGLTTDLTLAALSALGAIGAPTSSAVIAPYVQHRNADVRKAAALALAQTGGPDAANALRKGLRSSDATLRSLSAIGLGRAGDEQSVPDLSRAIDRGILEAAPSIGAIGSATQCDELLARLDKLPIDKQQATLEAMLHRKPALGTDLLLRAIAKVQAATGELTRAYFSSLERNYWGTARVKKALDAAAHAPKSAAPKDSAAPPQDATKTPPPAPKSPAKGKGGTP